MIRGQNRNFLRVLPALVALVTLLYASFGVAQRLDGTLRGDVRDPQGLVVSEAKVTVTNDATGVVRETTTTTAGTYVLPDLLPGHYTVTVEKSGFQKAVRKNVEVATNQSVEANIKLSIGGEQTTVEVVSGAEGVKTTTSDLTNSVSGKFTTDVPVAVPGGSVLEYAVAFPNTTTQPGGVLGSGGSIGGTRPRFNGFSIDGVDDNRADVNGPITPVIQDSVAEFTLITNQFSAEYGHSAGGQFAITTKSGTNAWHGEGHEYNRNRNYDAFDNLQKQRGVKDRYDYNRAGASIGGPILKNKIFIFGAYEFQNNGLAASSPTVTTPTAAGLTALRGMNPNPAVRAILDQFPVATTASGTTRVNGVNIPVGTFQSIAPSFTNQHDFNVNGDINIGKHQIRTRYLFDKFRAPDFNASQPQPQFLGTNASDARKGIVTDSWAVTNRLVNDFRVSYSRLIGPALIVPTAFANFPNAEIDDLGLNIGPDGNAPQSYAQNVYQLSDTMTYARGRHTLKWGVEGRHYIAPSDFLPRSRGEWDYANLQEFINDLVPTGTNGALRNAGSGVFAANNNALYAFLQDDIKLGSRLTLNIGLRYEYSGIPRDENLQATNAISDDPAQGLFFREPKPDLNNFAPRFGFAYDPFGNGKWAIRGGAGIAYDVTPANFAQLQLPPAIQSEQNPQITCSLANRPAWCASFLNPADGTGRGFLQGGGLLQVNVPPTNTADARALTQGLNVDQTEPKVLTWTLSVQHEVAPNTTVEARYLGTHSVSLPVQQRLNEVSALSSGLHALPTFFTNSAVPASFPLTSQRRQDFVNFVNNGLTQPLANDGFFSVFTQFPPIGQGIYHSGSVDVIHRFAHGLYLRGNYTYAHNIDNSTNELFSSIVNPRRPQDARNFNNERGNSALDIAHKMAITWVYDLPKMQSGNGLMKAIVNGWEYTGSFLAQTGQPITPLSGIDSNGNASSTGDRAIFNPAGTVRGGSGVNFVCINGTGASSIVTAIGNCAGGSANIVGYVAQNSAAQYVQANVGALSTAGRNSVSTPGLNLFNMALMKSVKVNERLSVQFRAETYNTFNHRNFSIGLPSNNGANDQVNNPNPLSNTYALVTSGAAFLNNSTFNGGSRTMQLGLKVIF